MKNRFKKLFSKQAGNAHLSTRRKQDILLRDLLLFLFFIGAAITVSNMLAQIHDDNNHFSVSIFILAVSLIARFTRGYLYGVLASLLGVFCVNYMFTYPYWEFNMSIAGYPLTFLVMLIVSISISTLTTRIKKQEQLRTEVEMEKMRANLLRSVSHDLRTPLTSIVGSSSVLLENRDLSAHQREELLREINKDARWLTQITENILSVTKFSNGRVKLKKEYEVVEEIVASAIVKFRKNHDPIDIIVHKPEEILLVPMDATLIEQVIVNLFDNAVVHGKRTSRITVCIEELRNEISISVADDGCGIPEAIFPHLFDGQASAYSARSDDRRNMGIGLSVCKSIIHAHEGRIKARNNQDGGARFELLLPKKEVEENEQT